MTSFSVESILFKDMYSNNSNTISNTKITKSLDDCVYDAYKSNEDLKFYETYTMINDYNNTQKLRMLNKLRYATNNIKNKQAHNSCESYIRSLEEDENKRHIMMTKENKKNKEEAYYKLFSNTIKQLDCIFTKPNTDDEIDKAEKQLGVTFSDEYKFILKKFGEIICEQIELNGVTGNTSNVILDTIKYRKFYTPILQKRLYVIYNPHIDNIVIAQDSHGDLYEFGKGHYNTTPEGKKICNSILQYIQLNMKKDNNVKGMQFKYVKPTAKSKIAAVTKKYGISSLPADLFNLIINNNGGRPVKSTFDSEKTKELVFLQLISYNSEDKVNMYTFIDAIREMAPNNYNNLYPVAVEPGGDVICLELHSKKIVHLNHETGTTEFVANSITDLISKLY